MWWKRAAMACVAVAALMENATRVSGQITAYRLPGATWTLGVPADWEVQDDEVVAARVKDALERIENAPAVKYAIAMVQKGHEERVVTVERNRRIHRPMSFDTAAKGYMEAWRKRSDESAKTPIGLIVESMSANPSTRQLVIIGESHTPGVEVYGIVMVMHFGARETVVVSAAAPLAAFKADHTDLMQIAASVAFDAGEGFAFKVDGDYTDISQAMGKVVGACLFLALIVYAIKKSRGKQG